VVLELGNLKWPEAMLRVAAPAGAFALVWFAILQADHLVKNPPQAVWISFFGAAAIGAIAAVRAQHNAAFREGCVLAATALAMTGIWMVTPEPYVTVAWTALGVAVLELGLSMVAVAAFAVIYGRALLVDLDHSAAVSMPAAIAAVYWLWFRLRDREVLGRIIFWLAPIPLLALVVKTAGVESTSPYFMALSLALLLAGIRMRIRDARIQSYIVAAGAFALALRPHNVWIAVAAVALLYACQFIAKKAPEAEASPCFSAGATLVLGKLIFAQASGSALTVGWGVEGLALLACGFAVRERVLRLEGLAVLLICILKLFLYDLRNLDTLPRILSFIVLGAIMLGVSWIYTRFRDHVKKLL
jgi:uncharacterized membrane protein